MALAMGLTNVTRRMLHLLKLGVRTEHKFLSNHFTNAATGNSSNVIQISIWSEFLRKRSLVGVLSRLYSRRRINEQRPQDFDIGIPIEQNMYPGYAYLHWGGVNTSITTLEVDDTNLSSSVYMNQTTYSENETDFLIDTESNRLNDSSSFYGSTTHTPSYVTYKQLIDDTFSDKTNISYKDTDEIMLRDIENYKILIGETPTDSHAIENTCDTTNTLKNTITHIKSEDYYNVLPSDIKKSHNSVNTNCIYIENPHLLQFTSLTDRLHTDESKRSENQHKPTKEQVLAVKDFLLEEVPKFFVKRLSYPYYHPDVVFENNFFKKPVVCRGLKQYILHTAKVRSLCLLMYAHLRVSLLSVSAHEEEGLVKVRWQVHALNHFKVYKFWKFLPSNLKKTFEDESRKYDGFSIFTVGPDGLIHKHKLDRVMQDESKAPAKMINKFGSAVNV